MNIDIKCTDVLEWATSYQGEPFHAIFGDPSYGWKFMNRKWDSDIALRPETWAALIEHLHPGGFIFAFGGPKTYHRLACALEDAGLRLWPPIAWLNCLSEDTEILTEHGWYSYSRLFAGLKVMCYNVIGSTFSYQPIEGIFIDEYQDTMFRIESDSTEQLVTPRHRCLVERNGTFIFREAASCQCQETVPVLEGVQGLQAALHGMDIEEGKPGHVLFGCLPQRSQFAFQTRAGLSQECSHANLSDMRAGILQIPPCIGKNRKSNMFKKMRGHTPFTDSQNSRMDRENSGMGQDWERRLDRRRQGEMVCCHDWRKQPGLEGGRDLLSQEGELREGQHQICSLPTGIHDNGPKRWIRYGTSPAGCTTVGASPETLRSCSPQGSQSREQQSGQSNAICQQQPAQTIRIKRIPETTLATIQPVEYKGIIWCVSVPTMAFVARRNGKIFITGNSQGFPKSTRIDTQIDKAAGKLEEREIIGQQKLTGNAKIKGSAGGIPGNYLGAHRGTGSLMSNANDGQVKEIRESIPITAPATDLARIWEGHRYGLQALKPCVELIAIAQKPYQGKSVDSIVETGAGAMWIDGSRIKSDNFEPKDRVGAAKLMEDRPWQERQMQEGRPRITEGNTRGRWPPNFCLSHIPSHFKCTECESIHPMQPVIEVCPDCGGELEFVEGCKRVGEKKVKGDGHFPANLSQSKYYGQVQEGTQKERWMGDSDNFETVTDWRCAEGCAVERLGEQSGNLKSGALTRSETARAEAGKHGIYGVFKGKPDGTHFPANEGTCTRFYHQSGWEYECVEMCPVARLNEDAGERKSGNNVRRTRCTANTVAMQGGLGVFREFEPVYGDSGQASRFYHNADFSYETVERLAQEDPVKYCPKAAKRERNEGLDDFYWKRDKQSPTGFVRVSQEEWESLDKRERAKGNIHPTVKPISLLEWLAKLLLPPKEYVPRRLLVPFSGSGSEIIGAMLTGWEEIVAIEWLLDYVDISRARCEFWEHQSRQMEMEL